MRMIPQNNLDIKTADIAAIIANTNCCPDTWLSFAEPIIFHGRLDTILVTLLWSLSAMTGTDMNGTIMDRMNAARI